VVLYRAKTQRAEALGVDTVRNIIQKQLNWIQKQLNWEFYPQDLSEWGIDAQVEVTTLTSTPPASSSHSRSREGVSEQELPRSPPHGHRQEAVSGGEGGRPWP
jgi:hypothetical protein